MRSLQLLVSAIVITTVSTVVLGDETHPARIATASVSSAASADHVELRHTLEVGWRAYQSGDLAQALTAYTHAVELAPEDATLWYDLGCLRALTRDAARAEAALLHALALQHDLAGAYDALGQLSEQQERYPLAQALYWTSHQLAPERAKFLRHLIRMYVRLQQPDAAQRALERLLMLAPRDLDARYELAVLQLRAGAPELAAHHFEYVVAHAPAHVMALNGLGLAYTRIGEYEKALKTFERARTLEPANAKTESNLGVLAATQQRWADARQAWQHALELEPEFAPASQNLQTLGTLTASAP